MSDTLLPTVWTLRDVTDVEQLCRGVLGRAGAHTTFRSCDFDESLAFLLGEVHIQDLRFVAKGYDRRAGYLFRPWLFNQLSSRLIDHWRSFYGRRGEKRVVDHRIVEQLHRSDFDEWRDEPEHLDDRGERRLGEVAAEVAVDGPETRTDAYLGFLAEGDRPVLRQVGGVGVEEDRGVACGHPRAAELELVGEAA